MIRDSKSSKTSLPASKRRKILVVDDEMDVLRSTQMLLERIGYDCVLLPEATHLVDVVEAERPDLILHDVVIPKMDLVKTMEALRGRPSIAQVPIVFFSAVDDLADRAAELDAAGFLRKPFSEQELVDMLQHVLGPMPPGRPGAAPPVGAMSAEAIRKYFHEYRNTLTALNNYAQFLLNSANIREPEREAVEELNRLLLELEKRNALLRAHLLGED